MKQNKPFLSLQVLTGAPKKSCLIQVSFQWHLPTFIYVPGSAEPGHEVTWEWNFSIKLLIFLGSAWEINTVSQESLFLDKLHLFTRLPAFSHRMALQMVSVFTKSHLPNRLLHAPVAIHPEKIIYELSNCTRVRITESLWVSFKNLIILSFSSMFTWTFSKFISREPRQQAMFSAICFTWHYRANTWYLLLSKPVGQKLPRRETFTVISPPEIQVGLWALDLWIGADVALLEVVLTTFSSQQTRDLRAFPSF